MPSIIVPPIGSEPRGTIDISIEDRRVTTFVKITGTFAIDWQKYRQGLSVLECLKSDNIQRI